MGIIEKAGALMESCSEIALASVNEAGYPRVCVLAKIKSEGIKKCWAATGIGNKKTLHFLANPKASVCVWNKDDSITLVGKVTVTRDRAVLEEMWLDWFIAHFPGGIDDPDYCILAFEAEEATLYVDNEFVTVQV